MASTDILGYFKDLTFGSSVNYWISLGVNIIISTIVGGIILAIAFSLLGKKLGESIRIQNVFIMILVLNLITFFGVLGFIVPLVGWLGLILPLLIWIIFSKLFLGDLTIKHAMIIGVVGFAITTFLTPMAVGYVTGMINI